MEKETQLYSCLLRLWQARRDEERARQRAALPRRAGYRAVSTVSGEWTTAGAEKEVRLQKTTLLQDGRALFWEEALTL
jgi:hypothetical protein